MSIFMEKKDRLDLIEVNSNVCKNINPNIVIKSEFINT